MTLQAVAREDVRQRIASGMVAFQAEQPKEQSRSYAIKKELKRIDRTFERIWQAIEDGIAPPGGKERTEELKQRKSELEAELHIAEREEAFNIGVDELMLWLDDAAENLTPEVILGTFVRFVEIDGKTLNVYFAFDRYGDDFRPKQKKAEPCPEGHSSTNSLVVEARRIELRSILNCPQGATGLVSDRASERIGSQTNVAAPSRFRLSSGHTDYVPRGIPLK